ncbi:hypothetical protein K488DRAFT_85267 [Vararia minispora EC-137]|uniref:Uncharacterized protein n=1 Tax=Vararia minispora EC-137 TaxID=1314806 RepID=A0ACB8QMF3_9AGAM|nr:hypothetical protein K488DRAFT_85267 [Vararia minispora EC-137]
MSDSGPSTVPHKRPRLDDSNGPCEVPEYYKDLWFEDGSVIFKCGAASFRVHRSVVCVHSQVFRDMFSVGTSDTMQDDVPVVEITDPAEKFFLFLKKMYFSHAVQIDVSIGFSILIDLLELATKYMVDFIRQEIIDYLHSILPCTLSDYEHQHDFISGLNVPELIMAIRAGWKYGIESIVPTALYALCVHHYGDITLWSEGSDVPDLVRIIALCALGYQNLQGLKRVTDKRAWSQAVYKTDSKFHCQEDLRSELIIIMTHSIEDESGVYKYWEDIHIFEPEGFYSGIAKGSPQMRVCDKCRERWKRWEKTAREDAWSKMPECFGLTWPDAGSSGEEIS